MSEQIKDHLSSDPVMRSLVERLEIRWPRSPVRAVYPALIQSIIFQQLSTRAAQAIYERFLAMFDHDAPSPEALLAKSQDELRTAGLSRAKSQYVQNVARHFLQHNLSARNWNRHDDQAIITELTQIKGVGVWTVQMLLIGALQRPDVFPVDDQVIRTGMSKLYGLNIAEKKLLQKKMHDIAGQWAPYRSYACRYIWAWKDTPV